MASDSPRRNPFFALTALLSGLFAVTILALLASILGDPRAPIAGFLDSHAGALLTTEVIGIIVTGFVALAVDRRQTLVSQRQNRPAPHVSEPSGRD